VATDVWSIISTSLDGISLSKGRMKMQYQMNTKFSSSEGIYEHLRGLHGPVVGEQ